VAGYVTSVAASLLIVSRGTLQAVTQDESMSEFFRHYATAFESLDVAAIAGFYALPCAFIGNAGVVTQIERGGLERLIGGLVAKYRAVELARAEVKGLHTQVINGRLLQVRVHWQLARADSTPLYEFDTIYIMANYAKRYRIASVIVVDEAERYQRLLQQFAGERTFIGKLPI
jgi:hypothetical protein